jgi:XTP/dITP diphosphohydrolase
MKLVMASANRGKLVELQAMLADLGVEVLSFADAGFQNEIVEDQPTFEGNARKKAEEVSQLTGWPALGDDSGLCVDALDGAPGVYSARYAGEPKSDAANIEKLLGALAGVPAPRTARFCCVLAFARPGAATITERGLCEGQILASRRGEGGFGYDPVFEIPSLGKTMAELPLADKNRLSHRAQAMARMLPHLRKSLQPRPR